MTNEPVGWRLTAFPAGKASGSKNVSVEEVPVGMRTGRNIYLALSESVGLKTTQTGLHQNPDATVLIFVLGLIRPKRCEIPAHFVCSLIFRKSRPEFSGGSPGPAVCIGYLLTGRAVLDADSVVSQPLSRSAEIIWGVAIPV